MTLHLEQSHLIENLRQRRKKQRISALLSFFLPGLGQFYSQRLLTAVFFLIITIISAGVILLSALFQEASVWGFLPLLIIIWAANIYDAHQGTYRETAPCEDKCPLGNPIRVMNLYAASGEWTKALAAWSQSNPFSAICGRVCYAPCENVCQITDAHIAIQAIERAMASACPEKERQYHVLKRPSTGKNVAVAGSGPAGLAAAHYLNLLGHKVTIFEAEKKAGGMLRYGIPAYRLPKKILDELLDRFTRDGIEIKPGTAVGRDITCEALLDNHYQALLIAAGAGVAQKLGIPGENLEGVVQGLTLLKKVNAGEKVSVPARCAVIGGGNVAEDSARILLRLGASEVSILYRRSPKEIPAHRREIEEAILEGVQFQYQVVPAEILGADGKVRGLRCLRTTMANKKINGRRIAVPVEGSDFEHICALVVVAIGQRPDTSWLNNTAVRLLKNGTVFHHKKTWGTSQRGIFVAGDAAVGPSNVPQAIAQGKQAALSIHKSLGGKGGEEFFRVIPPRELPASRHAQWMEGDRIKPRRKPINQRQGSFIEIEDTITQEDARTEAKRCRLCQL